MPTLPGYNRGSSLAEVKRARFTELNITKNENGKENTTEILYHVCIQQTQRNENVKFKIDQRRLFNCIDSIKYERKIKK